MDAFIAQLMMTDYQTESPRLTSSGSPPSDLITALMLDSPSSPTISLFSPSSPTNFQLTPLSPTTSLFNTSWADTELEAFFGDDAPTARTATTASGGTYGKTKVLNWGDADAAQTVSGYIVTPGFQVEIINQPSWKTASSLTTFTNTIVQHPSGLMQYQVTADDALGEVRIASSSSAVYKKIKQDVAALNGITLKGNGAVTGPVKFGYGQPRIAEVLRTMTGIQAEKKHHTSKRALKPSSKTKDAEGDVLQPPFISRKKRVVDDLDNDEHVSMQYYMTKAWKEFAVKDVVSLSEFRARVSSMMSDECVLGGGPVYAPSLSDIREFVASRK
jgi:hypothetical protein